MANNGADIELILAAEDFTDEDFEEYHIFSEYEDRIIRKLIAHGPVLLRGGRGSGKSALLKEAYYRVNKEPICQKVIGIYLSLRYLPLLRYINQDYEKFLCKLIIEHMKNALENLGYDETLFESELEVADIQRELSKLALRLGRRIIIFFDDAAHIGREKSLSEFFDIFRTLSGNVVSCKAAIYPGVTEFGVRFDVLNDATVVDIVRREDTPSFSMFFTDIMQKRYSEKLPATIFSKSLSRDEVATFLGRAVIGNVRAFIYACNYLGDCEKQGNIGLIDIEKTLKYLATQYYWPLIDEVEPKLGAYEVLIDPARELAEILFQVVSESMAIPSYGPSCLIHRDHVERLKKILEIMEYIGFIAKREASRAMKSGGRGTRYSLNLCNIMERITPNRLTSEMFKNWIQHEKDFVQIYKSDELNKIDMPVSYENKDLGILSRPINILQKSIIYPYGLTEYRISKLSDAGFATVKQLAEANDADILAVEAVGTEWLRRIKNVVGQAIWM